MRSFALTVLDLLRFGTIRDVANCLNFGWDLVKEVHKTKLQHLYRKMPIHKIKYLGIDEFSIKKAHHYRTIFIDLEGGRIVHAIKSTSKANISPFLEILARQAKHLKAIATSTRAFSGSVWIPRHIPQLAFYGYLICDELEPPFAVAIFL